MSDETRPPDPAAGVVPPEPLEPPVPPSPAPPGPPTPVPPAPPEPVPPIPPEPVPPAPPVPPPATAVPTAEVPGWATQADPYAAPTTPYPGAAVAGGDVAGGAVAPGYPPTYAAAPRSSNNAVVALVLAILSWVMCPLVLAVVALVFAAKGKQEIDESHGWVTGDGMVTAAKVISWINIVLSLIGLALFVVVLVAASVSTTR